MQFHSFVSIPFLFYSITFITATAIKVAPPGCTLNTERKYGFGYERTGRPLTSDSSVPCKPRPSLPKSAIAPRARIANGTLTIVKPIFNIHPNNDMDGLEEAEPNKPTRMVFTKDGRLIDASRAVVYTSEPNDDDGVFAYCEPDGYVVYNGRKDFWGCTREAGREKEEEKLFISTYDRATRACKPYRMRMLPCYEDGDVDGDIVVDDEVEDVGDVEDEGELEDEGEDERIF